MPNEIRISGIPGMDNDLMVNYMDGTIGHSGCSQRKPFSEARNMQGLSPYELKQLIRIIEWGQSFHDKHKVQTPKFKAGDYVKVGEFEPEFSPLQTGYVIEITDGTLTPHKVINPRGEVVGWGRNIRPATPAEIEQFRRHLAKNLGLKEGIEVEWKGQIFITKFNKSCFDDYVKEGIMRLYNTVGLQELEHEIPVRDWPKLKVVKPEDKPAPTDAEPRPGFEPGDWVKHGDGDKGTIIGAMNTREGIKYKVKWLVGVDAGSSFGWYPEKSLTPCDPPAPESETPFMAALTEDVTVREWFYRWAELLDKRLGGGK